MTIERVLNIHSDRASTLEPSIVPKSDSQVEMLRAVGHALALSEAMVLSVSDANGQAQLRGIRCDAAFAELRALATRLGLVDDARVALDREAQQHDQDADDLDPRGLAVFCLTPLKSEE